MVLSRILLLVAFSLCAVGANAQLDRTHVQGAASPYALSSDYRALGYNPALLTHVGWAGDYQKVSGGFEGGISLRSNLLDRSSMWDQILNRQSEEVQAWTTDEWLNALTDEELVFNTSFLAAAYARRIGKWGVAYANRRGVSAHVTLSSKTAKLFTDGGLDLYDNIELVETGEVVSVDDYDFELGDLWEGVTLAGDATLANLWRKRPCSTSRCERTNWDFLGRGATPRMDGHCTRESVPALSWGPHFSMCTPKTEVWWRLGRGPRASRFPICKASTL